MGRAIRSGQRSSYDLRRRRRKNIIMCLCFWDLGASLRIEGLEGLGGISTVTRSKDYDSAVTLSAREVMSFGIAVSSVVRSILHCLQYLKGVLRTTLGHGSRSCLQRGKIVNELDSVGRRPCSASRKSDYLCSIKRLSRIHGLLSCTCGRMWLCAMEKP